MKLYMVSELSISCLLFTLTPPPDDQCAGGTHPTGMHSCSQMSSPIVQFFLLRLSLTNFIVYPVAPLDTHNC